MLMVIMNAVCGAVTDDRLPKKLLLEAVKGLCPCGHTSSSADEVVLRDGQIH